MCAELLSVTATYIVAIDTCCSHSQTDPGIIHAIFCKKPGHTVRSLQYFCCLVVATDSEASSLYCSQWGSVQRGILTELVPQLIFLPCLSTVPGYQEPFGSVHELVSEMLHSQVQVLDLDSSELLHLISCDCSVQLAMLHMHISLSCLSLALTSC